MLSKPTFGTTGFIIFLYPKNTTMKNLTRFFSLLLLLTVLPCMLQAQNNKSKATTDNLLILNTGEKIQYSGETTLTAASVSYKDAKGKEHTVAQKDVRFMVAADRVFMNLPITKHMYRLQEVIAYNDDYILTYYFSQQNCLYVFDRNGNPVSGRQLINNQKYNQRAYDKVVKKYFAGCTELLDAMQKNLDKKNMITLDISMLSCGKIPLFEQ